MFDPDELGPVGFGAYRVDTRSSTHRTALLHALSTGCNLIDTASNYSDGRSEALIGEVLTECDDACAFVITKAGYVSPALARECRSAGVEVDLDGDGGQSAYRIDPDVLRVSLETSRRRLLRTRLDCVLIHNPEKLLEQGSTVDDVYAALKRAFSVLEEEVDSCRLRYYGISCNSGLDLDLVAAVAAESALANHFRFVEFPLNLLEQEAIQGSPSLLQKAQRLGLRTLSNRPLNALRGSSRIRLALYEDVAPECTSVAFDRCVEIVSAQLRKLGSEATWSDFAPMKFLRDNREGIPDPELVDVVWVNQVLPFVAALFGDSLTTEAAASFGELRTLVRKCAQAALGSATRDAMAKLTDFPAEQLTVDGLAEAACRYCLAAGVDHVLVGMRHPAYVRSLSALWSQPLARNRQTNPSTEGIKQ